MLSFTPTKHPQNQTTNTADSSPISALHVIVIARVAVACALVSWSHLASYLPFSSWFQSSVLSVNRQTVARESPDRRRAGAADTIVRIDPQSCSISHQVDRASDSESQLVSPVNSDSEAAIELVSHPWRHFGPFLTSFLKIAAPAALSEGLEYGSTSVALAFIGNYDDSNHLAGSAMAMIWINVASCAAAGMLCAVCW